MLLLNKQDDAEETAAALLERDHYCEMHPRSPTAIHRPRVMVRGRSFVALLGSTLEDGVAGIGNSVEAALHAFDIQFKNSLRSKP